MNMNPGFVRGINNLELYGISFSAFSKLEKYGNRLWGMENSRKSMENSPAFNIS